MKNKSILLILPYGSVGGMERLALTFYTYYISQGYRVKAIKLIKLESDIINFGEDEYSLSTIDFAQMSKVNRLFFYLKAPFRIRKIIKKEGITHAISFGDMTNIFSSLTFTKEFKIGSIHSLKSIELSDQSMFNRICKLSYKTSYSTFIKVVCISKSIKEDLTKNFNYKFSNLKVIYNPHDIKEVERLSEQKIDSEDERAIFLKKTILFVGRLSIVKAPWHLLNAFYILRKTERDLHLVFIGDGDTGVTDYLKKRIKDLKLEDCVFLLGRKKNPYTYIKAAKVVALTSYTEGTPNVIIESIVLGTPVVSTNSTGGILEIMSHKKQKIIGNTIETESGIITPSTYKGVLAMPSENTLIPQEEDIANSLLKICVSNEIEEGLKKEKENLLSKFDMEVVAKQYVSN